MSDLARRWLTIPAAATATGRSERTIRRWITDNRLRHLDVAGTRYVNELELLDVERTTRHGARQGNRGARGVHMLDGLRIGGLTCGLSGVPSPREPGP